MSSKADNEKEEMRRKRFAESGDSPYPKLPKFRGAAAIIPIPSPPSDSVSKTSPAWSNSSGLKVALSQDPTGILMPASGGGAYAPAKDDYADMNVDTGGASGSVTSNVTAVARVPRGTADGRCQR